jgi:small ligand-binding sensory domain FIST
MHHVNRYAAALSQHPTPVEAAGEVAGEILERFDGGRADLLVCFASPHHVGAFEDIANGLRKLLEPEAMIGCTAVAIAGGTQEVEDSPALSVFAASFGAGTATAFALDAMQTDDGYAIVGWPDELPARGTLLLLADPYSFPVPDVLGLVNAQVPDLVVVGGLASSAAGPGGNRLVCDERIATSGAVAVLLSEDVPVQPVVSQGCRPIGQPYTVTRAERNLVYELAGLPAMQRLQDLVLAADEDERDLMRQGLHLGVVVDEHKLDFGRGDFLVRNLLGADQDTGALAVGDTVDIGQTVQFHVRDADAADEDLRILLRRVASDHEWTGDGALLFTCNGRGTHMFSKPDHDVGVVADVLGHVPLAGAFCAGEIGPIGGRSFLHGFTASLVVFGR